MAVTTKDLVIDIDELTQTRVNEINAQLEKPKVSALYFKGKTKDEAISSFYVDGNDLNINLENDFVIVIKDYFIQNGKNAVKYIKTDEAEQTGKLFSFIDDCLIDNNLPIVGPQKGNVISGTVFNDTQIVGTALNDVVKALEGNDIIYGSGGNDTITGGKGLNELTYELAPAQSGDDIVNLTKGEELHITNISFNTVAEKDRYTQVKQDLKVKHDKGTILIKNYYAKDTGATVKIFETGADPLDPTNPVDHAVLAQIDQTNYFAPDAKGKVQQKYTGSALADHVDVSGLANPIKVVKETNQGVILNTGLGDDSIIGSEFNDTITAGTGDNTIDYSSSYTIDANKVTNVVNFGDDVINLTKGENLTITGLYFGKYDDCDNTKIFTVNKNDLIVTANNGTVTLKNYLSKDLGATVTIQGISGGADEDVQNYANFDLADRSRYSAILPIVTSENFVKGKYTGTALSDFVDASGVQGSGKDNLIGATIDTGAGGDSILGSNYKDVIKAGAGDDMIVGSLGADSITGGTGSNRITYTDINHIEGDVITLTKDEDLTIDVSGIANAKLKSYKLNKQDAELTITDGNVSKTLIIKGFGANDVTGANGNVELKLNNLVTHSLKHLPFYNQASNTGRPLPIAVDKNFTGTWHSDNITAENYDGGGKDKGLLLDGKDGDDYILGSEYNDTLKAGTGEDTLIGYVGNDVLYSGTTADSRTTFKFQKMQLLGNPTSGDGNDIINQGKGEDTIVLYGVSMTDEELKFEQDKKDLKITYAEENGTITIKNYFLKPTESTINPNNSVKNIVFEDGEFLLEKFIPNQKEDDKPSGYVEGTDNDDTLNCADTNDIIYAKKGNDLINAGKGNNLILYNHGDNSDTIHSGGGNDTLLFADAEDIEDLRREYDGDDVKIFFAGDINSVGIGKVTLKDYKALDEDEDATTNHSVQTVRMQGEDYNVKDVRNYINRQNLHVTGTDYNDDIYTTYSNQNKFVYVADGEGDDIIHITDRSAKSVLYLDAGNDTISYEADKRATIEFESEDGNNVLVGVDENLDSKSITLLSDDAQRKIDLDNDYFVSYYEGRYDGDDFVLKTNKEDEEEKTFTIKNYKNLTDSQKHNISLNYNTIDYINFYSEDDIIDTIQGGGVDVQGCDNKLIKINYYNNNITYGSEQEPMSNDLIVQQGSGTQQANFTGTYSTLVVSNSSSGLTDNNTIYAYGSYNNFISFGGNITRVFFSDPTASDPFNGGAVYTDDDLYSNNIDVRGSNKTYIATPGGSNYNWVNVEGKTNASTSEIQSNSVDYMYLGKGVHTVDIQGNMTSGRSVNAYEDSHITIKNAAGLTGKYGKLNVYQYSGSLNEYNDDDFADKVMVSHYHNNSANKTVDGEDSIGFVFSKNGTVLGSDKSDINIMGSWSGGTFDLDTQSFDQKLSIAAAGFSDMCHLSGMTQYVDMATANHAFNDSDSTLLSITKDVAIQGTENNDSYTFATMADVNKQITITEAGGNDTLTVTANNKFRLFFDVDTEGNFKNDLYIFETKGLDAGDYYSEMDRFIRQGRYKEDEGENYRDANYICIKNHNSLASAIVENIISNNKGVNVNGYISAISESIASWLNNYNNENGTDYNTVMEAIKDGAGNDSLFATYTSNAETAWNDNLYDV